MQSWKDFPEAGFHIFRHCFHVLRQSVIFADMKVDFLYSTDFFGMNDPKLSHTCMHLICKAGVGSFVFNERPYTIRKNDMIVMQKPDRATDLGGSPDLEVEWFAADYKFLQNLLPSNNFSIGGSISLNINPIVTLTDAQSETLLADIRRLRDRMGERDHEFYRELMGSLCLTLIYDIFVPHSRRDAAQAHSDRTAHIVKRLMQILSTGVSATEREVSYYAGRLNVSPKYLSTTVKRVTGQSVSKYIHRHTVPIMKDYLGNESLSLTQIAELMNFCSLSHFSRYCTKHLGQSPSEYRQSLQPREN